MLAYRERRLGKTAEVLFEEPAVIDGMDCYIGFSREYVPYAICKDAERACDLSGTELTVTGERLLSDGTILAH